MHAMEHFHTSEVPTSIALWVSLLSIGLKEFLFQWTVSIGKKQKSSLLIANAWHHRCVFSFFVKYFQIPLLKMKIRTDAISSLVALVGIVGSQMGVNWLDPLAGMVVAGLIVKVGVESSWEGIKELVDASTDPELEQQASSIVKSIEGVQDIKWLRTRKMGPAATIELSVSLPSSYVNFIFFLFILTKA